MRLIYTIFSLIIPFLSFSQEKNADFENLVKLGEIYSMNVNATGGEFKKAVQELRTPGLDHMIDALLALGKGDKKLLTKKFLAKPSEQELKYWYVLREIYYNNQLENTEAKPNLQVAKETLAKDIDSRWLLDNYYYRIQGGIAKMFNDQDLSKYDINLDDFGLANETEKAIVFFAISNALTERFRVLQMMKNYDKLLEYINKLPRFQGKPYYEYTSFDFEDFDWIAYKKVESYKERHLGQLYAALNGYFLALAEKDRPQELRHLYFNSILFIPDYFKYAGGMEEGLQELYDKSKK